jgi:hypothetical protein
MNMIEGTETAEDLARALSADDVASHDDRVSLDLGQDRVERGEISMDVVEGGYSTQWITEPRHARCSSGIGEAALCAAKADACEERAWSLGDFEQTAAPFAHAAGAGDRTEGARDAALAADHVPHVLGCDVQPHDELTALAVDRVDAHSIWIPDQAPGEVLDQFSQGSSP